MAPIVNLVKIEVDNKENAWYDAGDKEGDQLTTKDRVLTLLSACRGTYLSGEELAQSLQVSRAAVWKAISALREAGYPIDGVSSRGYRLLPSGDILSLGGIESRLCFPDHWHLEVLGEVSSTNALLRTKGEEGAPDGTVLVAASQTLGRGRLGRKFYSPADTGVYLSVLIRRDWPPTAARDLTVLAAVAAARAVEALSQRKAKIKWVNDIFLEGKKVCGILTEASFRMEEGTLDYAVLGVGFNAYRPKEGFPESIAQVAGAVYDAPREEGRNALAAGFLNELENCLLSPMEAKREYRNRSLVLGREVQVMSPNGSRSAKALDLDEHCGLIVEYPDGTRETLRSGEISIRI